MKYLQEHKPSAVLRPKQTVLAKLMLPHKRTVKDVAAEEGISPATLYHWHQQAHLNGDLFPDVGADPEGFDLSSAEGSICELSTGCVFAPDRRDWHYQTTTLYERRFK